MRKTHAVDAVPAVPVHPRGDERGRHGDDTRLRHANRFGSFSRQRKTFSVRESPTTTTGDVADADRLPDGVAGREEDGDAPRRRGARRGGPRRGPRPRRRGPPRPRSRSAGGSRRRSRGSAGPVCVRGADSRPPELLDVAPSTAFGFDRSPLPGLRAAEAEVRRLEARTASCRPGHAVAGWTFSRSMPPELHPALVGAACRCCRRSRSRRGPTPRRASRRSPAGLDRPRFSRISIHALREALAEGAGDLHQAALSSWPGRRGRPGARRGAARWPAICGSCVTRRTVLPMPVQLSEERQHLVAGLRVEGAGRLVGEEEGRPVRERPRDGDALALPARELRREDVRLLGDPDLLEQLERPRRRSLRPRPA